MVTDHEPVAYTINKSGGIDNMSDLICIAYSENRGYRRHTETVRNTDCMSC